MKSVTLLFLFLHVLKTMAAPPVTAIQNCPHGNYVRDEYIKQGTVATCECEMKNISEPLAQAEWHNSKGEKVGSDTVNGVSILTIKPRPENKDESYTCVGVSLDSQGPPMIYKPKIAYGPSKLHMEINGGSKTFVMCDNNAVHVQVSIATDSVNPKPDIVLDGLEDHQIVSHEDSVQGKFYIYDYKVMLKKESNLLHVSAIAKNPIFSEILAYNYEYTHPVRHSSSPVLTLGDENGSPIANGSSQPVAFGEYITVRCKMPVADPNVNNVTIKCFGGILSKSDGGTHTSLAFLVKEEMDKEKCTCITHDGPSGCYNLKTEFVLRVNYLPTSPPVMTLTGAAQGSGNTRVVSQGRDITINCRVDGGQPGVRSVYITCGSRHKEDNGTEATLVLRVKKEMNGQQCLCGAHHVTGRYNKKAQFTFDVHYIPLVKTFTANSFSNSLEVSGGDKVNLLCEAIGNPRPNPQFFKQHSQLTDIGEKVTSVGSDTSRLQTTLQMGCGDSGTFFCYADHGQGHAKNITVSVKCSPQFAFGNVVKEFYRNSGDDLSILLSVKAYPEPTRFVLQKMETNKVYRGVRNATYNVVYTRSRPTIGQIMLHMFGPTDGMSGQYKLTISNGVGHGLDYNFNVTTRKTTVTKFTANDLSPSAEVSKGDTVTFTCEVDGDTTHNLLLTGQRSNISLLFKDVIRGNGTKRSEITKTVTCNDTDVYTCAADDDDTGNSHKTVSVFVICPGSNNSIFDNIGTTHIAVAVSILLILVCVVAVLKVVCKRRKTRETTDAAVSRIDNKDCIEIVEVHRPRKQQVDSWGYEMPTTKMLDRRVYANLDGKGSEHLSGADGGASPVDAFCKDGGNDDYYDDEVGEDGYMILDCAKAASKEYENK